MIENQNGLTGLRAPRLVKKNKFFWPAPFPDEFLALRHFLLGEKPYFTRLALTTLDVLDDKKNIHERTHCGLCDNKIWEQGSLNLRHRAAHSDPFPARCHGVVARQSISSIEGQV